MPNIELKFRGPFTFGLSGNSIFLSSFNDSTGIYLWTFQQNEDNSYLIHYVGETTSLGKRHEDHLNNILGFYYGIFDAESAKNGSLKLLWKGLWRDNSQESHLNQITAYRELHEAANQYVDSIRIFFAETFIETHLRKHIEGCIGWNLRKNHPEQKVLYPDDNHVGKRSLNQSGNVLISSSVDIKGLDSKIPY